MADTRPKERFIIGVAIRMKGGDIYLLPEPYRHPDLIAMLAPTGKYPVPIKGHQGFIDNNLTFVGRHEAAALVIQNGQLKELSRPGAGLFSEDLW